jgi:hypothetical protein
VPTIRYAQIRTGGDLVVGKGALGVRRPSWVMVRLSGAALVRFGFENPGLVIS